MPFFLREASKLRRGAKMFCAARMRSRPARFFAWRLLRTLRRDGLDRRHADWLLDRVEMLHLSQAALNVAESVERHIKSLDAIHLATAMLDGGAVTVVTHDRTMGEVAEHLEQYATTKYSRGHALLRAGGAHQPHVPRPVVLPSGVLPFILPSATISLIWVFTRPRPTGCGPAGDAAGHGPGAGICPTRAPR